MSSDFHTIPEATFFIVSDYRPHNRLTYWGMVGNYNELKSYFDIGVWKIKKLKQ
jgi:hypothetical protein